MRAYSQDLRDRVLRALERGERPSEIARRFEVSRGWVYQVREDWQREGRRTSLQIGGHRRSRLADREPQLRAWLEQQPDLTLAELCARLLRELDLEITISALWYQLDKWGLTLKKNASRQRARAARRTTGALAVARESRRSWR